MLSESMVLPEKADRPGLHPLPPVDLNERSLLVIKEFRLWKRIHRSAYNPIFFGKTGSSRFDDQEREFGVLYLGGDAHCAFIETFGQATGSNTVTQAELEQRSLSSISTERPLVLVDLTGPELARIGADTRLLAGEHSIAQQWSRALREHPERPDGVYCRARHDPSRMAVAVWEPCNAGFSTIHTMRLASTAYASELGEILDTYGFDLL